MDVMPTCPENSNQFEGELHKQNNDQVNTTDAAALDQAMWSLLVLLSRKLQVSSASIKAGVSSLLDQNIFWDGSTQHEFLESINSSTDQVSRLITLLSLVTRAKAGMLEMKIEPQMLQEIVSIVRDQVQNELRKLSVEITLPQSGKPVLVDYEYLMLALRLLFEVFSEISPELKSLSIFAFEVEQHWELDIVSDKSLAELFTLMEKDRLLELLTSSKLSPDVRLKIYIVCQIFILQHIYAELVDYSDRKSGFRIIVPCSAAV
jgi:hypothetical protein